VNKRGVAGGGNFKREREVKFSPRTKKKIRSMGQKKKELLTPTTRKKSLQTSQGGGGEKKKAV